MKYLIAVEVSDVNELEPAQVCRLREILGDSAYLSVAITERTKPMIIGEWMDAVDEIMMFNDVSGKWVDEFVAACEAVELEVVWIDLADTGLPDQHDFQLT